jgi:nucleoid-associated protein YgaU
MSRTMSRSSARDLPGQTTAVARVSPGVRLARLGKGIGALLVLFAVVVGVPVLMTVLNLVPHSLPTRSQALTSLKARDNGQLVAGVIAAGVWVCWALFTLSLLPEIAALARHRPARTLAGLGGFQRPAGALVAAVALAFTLVPIAVDSRAPRADAAGLPTVSTHSISQTLNPSTIGTGTGPSTVEDTAELASLERTAGLQPSGRHGDPHASEATDRSTPATTLYEVQRRDTLWDIAARHLGDPLRYREIVELNRDLVGPDNEITPGTVLRIPTVAPVATQPGEAAGGANTVVRVEPGDTLWGIEEHVTGSGINWPQAWAANKGRPEPGGARLTDPALIRPGWSIDIPPAATSTPGTGLHQKPAHAKPAQQSSASEAPGTVTSAPHQAPGQQAPGQQTHRHGQAPVPVEGGPAQTEKQAPMATAPDAQGEPTSVRRAPSDAASDSSSELPMLAFAGGGMLLASLALTALVSYRRRQFRERRPGRTISGTPPELVGLEQALLATGRAGSADVQWLDHALRSLTQALAKTDDGQLPDVVAACMTGEVLTLVLTTAARQAPLPWTVDASGTRWSVRRTDELSYTQEARSFFFAPFPTLVSVGYTAGGEHWMLDLERIAAMSLAGDEARCLNLMRFVAAELAHNSWSEMLRVTLVGFGQELVGVNPNRLAYTEDVTGAIAALNRHRQTVTAAMTDAGVDVLTGRLRDVLGDSWAPNVLLIAPHLLADNAADAAADSIGLDGLAELLSAMKAQPSRASIALVLAADPEAPQQAHATRWQLTVDSDGILRIPALGLELIAQQIPASEAAGLAQMLALAAACDDQPVPAARGQQPWDEFADACGGLILPPAPTQPEPAGPGAPGHARGLHLADSTAWVKSSVLPLPPETYLEQTATTEQDLLALAPQVDSGLREQVTRADPDLDADLAAWADPICPRPRLTLLGPVAVRAAGQLPARSPQLAFHTEVVAYLATRPAGVLSDRYARAIWPSEPDVVGKTKVRESVSTVRAWLGEDPATRQPYLPSGSFEAGRARYRINQLLCDAELFRRLRLRGVARGPEGIGDLQSALELVTGEPFADLPTPRKGSPGGYSWLADANSRLDHEYAAMIVDVAHIVATHHLAAGEPAAAAAAAQVALRAGSYEDVPLLDLVAACDAQDQRAEADAYVKKILANHDAEVEEDLPPRTAQVLFRRQWTHRAS